MGRYGAPYPMARRPQPKDYESYEFIVLHKTAKAVLVIRPGGVSANANKGWLPKSCLLKVELIDKSKPEHCEGLYRITAQRYVFTRAGVI